MRRTVTLTPVFVAVAALALPALPMRGEAQTGEARPASHPPLPVRFTLTEPAYVTLVIEDAQGMRVRNLISETSFPTGENVAWWDGLDDVGRDTDAAAHAVYHLPGKLVAPGTYRVRGLVRPALELRYQMTPYNEGAPPWQTADKSSEWLSNHTPPMAVLFVPPGGAPVREGKPSSAGAQILVGSFVSEGGSGLAWLDMEGHKLHGQGWVGGVWTGASHLARDEGDKPVPGVYAYTGSAWDNELRLYELRKQIGPAPRDTRMGSGDDQPVLTPKWEFPGGGGAWNKPGGNVALSGLAAHNGLIAASLPKLNEVLFVDGKARGALGTVPVADPRGLAFDRQGRLLVLSGKRLLCYQLPSDLTPYLKSGPYYGEALDRKSWAPTASAMLDLARQAIDGDYSSRWETRTVQTPGMWFVVDLGAPQAFTTMTMNNAGSSDAAAKYEVYISSDGQNWGQPIATGVGAGATTVVTVSRVTARYVKIVQTGSSSSLWWSINELHLYNQREAYVAPTPKPLPAPQVLVTNLEDPQQMALDAQGNIYVSDRGNSHSVKVFSAQGKFVRAIGTPGVPRAGVYDQTHMNNPSGLTIDDRNRLWVAEDDFQPKRVSVWTLDGRFLKGLYGPPRYGGGGELDVRDTRTFYYDGMRFQLDWDKGTSWPVEVFYRPGPGDLKLPGWWGTGPQTPLYVQGRKYMTNAYNDNPTNGAGTASLWLIENHVARPVAAVGRANDWELLAGLFRSTENFSVRWIGQVQPQFPETYTFTTVSDDGVRLWVNGKQLIDNWMPHGTTEDNGTLALEAGKRYDLKLEYFQGSGGGSIKLLWSSPSQPRQLIPASRLYPDARSAKPGGLTGEYYDGTGLNELKGTRTDATVDFDYTSQPPAPLLGGSGAAFRSRLPEAVKPGDPVTFVWSDLNGDAQAQPDEVTFAKGDAGGITVMPDLSFALARLDDRALRLEPVGFTTKGAPRYDISRATVLAEGAQRPTSTGGDQVLAGKGGWSVHTVAPKPFAPQGVGGAYKGEAKWSYPSLWPGLHASHIAPLPEHPGELIGTTRLLGNTVTPGGSDVGEVWAINGNKGNIYLLTSDGLFVATLFKDSRTASWSFPEAKKEMLVNEASTGEESFWPSLSQTSDGTIYLTAHNGCIVRVDGLEKIRRLPTSRLEVTAPMLQEAQAYFLQSEAQRQSSQAQGPLLVALRERPPVVDGKLDDWAGANWVTIDTRMQQEGDWGRREVKTEAALAVSGDRLYAAFKVDDSNLLSNSGEAWQNLFKTGGALDLMIGTDPQADPQRDHAVAGDVRLLVTRIAGKPTAVLYRPVAPGTTTEPVLFSSPLRTLRFGRVDVVSDQVQLAGGPEGAFELSVPLATLGLEPKPGLTLRGDVGILRGNGFQTLQRVYWHNKATGLTSDIPSEAELTPQLWGQWVVGG